MGGASYVIPVQGKDKLMRVLVTGATGFIGGNIVHALINENFDVRILIRKGSDTKYIQNLKVEKVEGDLLDGHSLRKALADCDALFHAAAVYTFWSKNSDTIYNTNLRGTENILSIARESGIKKIVYTSTESTIGIDESGLGKESLFREFDDLSGDYKKSKYLAEKAAMREFAKGLPVVIVNPTMPVGPGDVKPTPSGKVIVDFINRKMPACIDTGLNLVDAEDVAKGHILALQKGRPGERYILGNTNVTLRDLLSMLEDITGVKAPRYNIPIWLAQGASYVSEFISGRITGRYPRIPVAAVKTAREHRYFDCSKSVRELGLPRTPLRVSLKKAVDWFSLNGYVRNKKYLGRE